ncbi:hypothetical protein V9L05_18585 [Bernardetia sp. Wsw4-3y2]|uniref:hypothetical protein n=1 Tax=Bernardetia sp. Wsw4-3y2 TaxID=3127471 RepID=UPI0030D400C2
MQNENINQQEKQLFLSILQELEQIPKEYLKVVFGVVQAFRQNLPSDTSEVKEDAETFDWEELSDEIMKRRKEDNQQFFKRMDNFINE